MDLAVQTFALTKRFGDFTAVDHIDLEIKSEVFGLLGPNGAGKTTLARMLTTILQPTEGTATVAGADIRDDYQHSREGAIQSDYLAGELQQFRNLFVS